MSEHFMLECYMPIEWDDMALLEGVFFAGVGSWRLGRRFKKQPPNPVIVEISPGYPNDLKEMYYNDAIIITKRLLAALQEAGVDNLDVYPCIIVNEDTGFRTEDYVAINLIGLVKAADIANSKVTGGDGDHLLDTDFDGVAIDPKKAKDYLMFRLAENTSAIVIHRSVKEHLVKKGFNMLTYVEPKDWIG
ncbi:imm11 family protein [Aliikangiella coralliicola]|uniref:Immunity MXAN-0049 protein domain-containing protein n=1 Tax=Aliikangiella coralliicola TaxID=2592383 RepID=A0A545U8U3_9GAMM|nr:DUF1629 domain-containing protein [Aliikangiella coralliicola]TQV85886.1 hypothetical protein FLL46_18355 [Aliikangiella coralliicola]